MELPQIETEFDWITLDKIIMNEDTKAKILATMDEMEANSKSVSYLMTDISICLVKQIDH